jgi:hypothetical protein
MFGNYTISDSCSAQNHVCEVDYSLDPSENFQDNSLMNSFLYAISCASLICLAGILFHFTNKTIVFYKDFSIISVLAISLIFAFDVYTMGKDTCHFARWCHEGIDNQIIPSFYFYQMNECPRVNSWLGADYSDSDMNHNDNCETSEYGCCEVLDIDCDAAYSDDDNYSFYQMIINDYRGSWSISVNKQDKEGTNCPTVEDIIYQASKNDNNDYLVNTYLSYTITAMIFMCICMICNIRRKDDYEKTDSEDVEKAKFVLKESV